ncbi:terminase large subunit [Carnobacteriaceae bacterium zg-ZUI252]|nr:terminase large subunit [Carnobacteriaceae bacterium zg-ZUI252]
MTTLKDLLISYAKECIETPKLHCQKERWACERFLKDVERENTSSFPYVFDNGKAMRFLTWTTKFKHTKGILAGRNIDPAPIQMFIFGNLYGWVHRETGYRRFKKSYWQVARKNAKTQSNACVSSYESSALGEPYSEVYIGATQTEQARILWNEVKAQIESSEFKEKFKTSYGKITHEKSGGYIKALSKESGKTGDGFNVQCALIDEYHAHKTSEILDVMVSGMVSRPQPLLSIITTAGFDLNNPCYSVEYQYVSKLLNPDDDVENEEYFAMVNELDAGDDIKDENNWFKANPIVASNEIGMAFLRSELKMALDVPEKMRNFLTKNMNVWVDMPENGYMDISKWESNTVTYEEVEDGLKNSDVIFLGVDLSATTDLTSLGLVGSKGKDKYIKHISFMPSDKFYERMNTDKVPYDLYVKDNKLILTDGATVDYTVVKSQILKWCKEYRVKAVCFDKYNAINMMWELENEGINVVEIPQSIAMLSPATKEFRNDVYNGNVKHDGDKLLKRALLNAHAKSDDQENIMLSKRISNGRIDPIASVINAYSRVLHEVIEDDVNSNIAADDWSF